MFQFPQRDFSESLLFEFSTNSSGVLIEAMHPRVKILLRKEMVHFQPLLSGLLPAVIQEGGDLVD